MPHDPEEVIAFAMREHAQQAEQIAQLKKENAQLRGLLSAAKKQVEEILQELETALDEDRD
jgi:hypothetical protein